MHRCIIFVDEHHHLLASLLGGSHDDVLEASFPIDMVQGDAGISVNMNAKLCAAN